MQPGNETQETTEIPAHLLCETCGARPIQVAVLWLSTSDSSQACMPCFLSTAAAMIQSIASEEPAEPTPDGGA